MGVLEDKINKFLELEIGYGYGSGYGNCNGDGSGDGSGYGDGDGSGYGYGYGSIFGYGNGDGSGYGYGNGYGYGSGYGDGLKTFNNKKIYRIDDTQTIIEHIKGNIAKGKILTNKLTTKDCYIAKGQNKFAHGETIKKAEQALQEKIFEDLDTDETIEQFKEKFKLDKKYKGTEFYLWHHILTGSCEMGRNNFVENHNIDLENEYTVQEFIELTENYYGGEIIEQLKDSMNIEKGSD